MDEAAGLFVRQAEVARRMGFPFTGRIMETLGRRLPDAPKTAAAIKAWPGDLQAGNIPLRLGGALHALALRRATPALADLYRTGDGDVDAVLSDVLRREDDTLLAWLGSPPQTNEVGRSAALWAALQEIAAATRHPDMELLELGSSAGLNLNLARYGYDLGGRRSGAPDAAVTLRPDWRGAPAPEASPVVRRARGVDLAPLDARDPATRERLRAFVWPDDPERGERLERALAIAAADPPAVDRGDAASWLEARLAEPQDSGVVRVVLHSIVLQYLSEPERVRVHAALADAGSRATADRPLAWVAFEWDVARDCAALHLRLWPDGGGRELATCQAHGAWIAWEST